MKSTAFPNQYVISKCLEMMKTFNPITHSIDTHCLEQIGDTNSPKAKPENVLIQQILYGWQKEKEVLKGFIDNFYADNASRVLRVDINLYTILAYLGIYRLSELGFERFRGLALSQEPTKVTTFITYLFDKENLHNSLRADWMKVRDLDYVENELIATILQHSSVMIRFISELEKNAASNAALEAEKEELKKNGKAGLGAVVKKASTRPFSPRITQTRPPNIPEPERIIQNVQASPVPDHLDYLTLEKIERKRKENLEETRKHTLKQYESKKLEFKLGETKGGRPVEELKKEAEDKLNQSLDFDKSFYHEPPDFKKGGPIPIRLNAATILREDALYRKQQAKDVELIKNYEKELRDPIEYYLWQKQMKERDEAEKLKLVILRREQAKQSAADVKDAIIKSKEDNRHVADLLREQADEIKQQKLIENEIVQLKNQEIVQNITEIRDVKPKEAMKKVYDERIEVSKKVREELEQARLIKEEEERRIEELKADRIRQLRALNTIHRKHIVVFDPTMASGLGLLDEMSFLEMKARLEQDRIRAEENEIMKRNEILDDKNKKLLDLEYRTESLMKARQIRTETTNGLRLKEKEKKQRENELKEKLRKEALSKLEKELHEKHEQQRIEQEKMKKEQEKIKRNQQYLGAAVGQLERMREKQMEMAKERQIREFENLQIENNQLNKETNQKERKNKKIFTKQIMSQKEIELEGKELNLKEEKRIAVQKIKTQMIEKKDVYNRMKQDEEEVKKMLIETNPYAHKISKESIEKSRRLKSMDLKGGGVTSKRQTSYPVGLDDLDDF